MNKFLRLLFTIALILFSCKKDNNSNTNPSIPVGTDNDWTISTSSTFHLKDILDVVYVHDNKEDETLEATVTLSKLPNKNNPRFKV